MLAHNPWTPGAISVSELAGRNVSLREAEEAILAACPFDLSEGELTVEERAAAERLVASRYGNATWTNRR